MLGKPPKAVRTAGDDRFWIDSVVGLLGLVEMGAVELHAANVTIDDLERPDMLVFSVTSADAALRLSTLLKTEGLESWPKLTGSRELHVMVPIEPDLSAAEALRYSEQLAGRLAKANIDCRHNKPGATAIAAFSPRSLPGFPIAAPVEWAAVQRGIAPDAFTMEKPRGNGATSP
jgi:bifunctional non-homologous end joining protein LigD